VFGDRKPYLVALLNPNIERLIDLAREKNISYIDIEGLVNNKLIKELFEKRLAAINKQYPSYKTIKYFAIIPREFSIEGGELTPTLKMKRKVIYDKYKEIVDDLYITNGNGIMSQQKK
jgi:long-chain acyl-CoA synthetase